MSAPSDPADAACREALLRGFFEASLSGRVRRSLQIQSPTILPATPFATITAECVALYTDGYFFACVCLSQIVAEGITRHIYERLQLPLQSDHIARVKHLARAQGLTRELRRRFLRIHRHRHDFHHLNPTVPNERGRLQQEALEVATSLVEIEHELFRFDLADAGAIAPRSPLLWCAHTPKE